MAYTVYTLGNPAGASSYFEKAAKAFGTAPLNKTDNDAIYDLQGRKVNSKRATGGIYIVNGKKVLVK